MAKCKECGTQLKFGERLSGGVCKLCKKSLDKNREAEKKMQDLVEKKIADLEEMKEDAGEEDYYPSGQVFEDEQTINCLYNMLFSSVIYSLYRSFKSSLSSFEHDRIKEEIFNDFEDFIEPWIKKAKDENYLITKEEYSKFRDDVKKIKKKTLKDLHPINLDKIVKKLEENMKIYQLMKKIDDFAQKIKEELRKGKEGEIQGKIFELKERDRKRKIREEAEKEFYGKIKTKRLPFTEEEKDMILGKFDNKCTICGATEGLHIHHKDGNPKNNRTDNLIVLCGVCHKKIHMKVR